MSANGYTAGPWSINNWPQSTTAIAIGAPGTPLVAKVPLRDVSINEQEANARLIAEAGTVAHETGLTPRQLAEQRAELLEALQTAFSESQKAMAILGMPLVSHEFHETARAALAKATGSSK